MRLGVRVVRGPHWRWQDQDGGEGFVGTVVGMPATAPGTCYVQWDCRQPMNYRAGSNDRYDLRVFDSAPSGVKHDFACDGCSDRPICGLLWICATCTPNSVCLCTTCYMNDRHLTVHVFRRLNQPNGQSVLVPPRHSSRKIDSFGIFCGAIVRQGPDWIWGDQDLDGHGNVTQLQGWSEESSRSVVCVEWQNRSTNVYRLGHRGKCDLTAVKVAKGWPYYVDHLPNFGEEFSGTRLPIFTAGEAVRVDSNLARVKKLADGHGQWHENMKNYIGQCGIVHRITENDDVRVIFPDRHKWTYNPKAISKVCHVFQPGANVMLTEDLETLKEYHGDLLKTFSELRGCHGTVTGSRSDSGLCNVLFAYGQTFPVHANCLYFVDTANIRQPNALSVAEDRSSSIMTTTPASSSSATAPTTSLIDFSTPSTTATPPSITSSGWSPQSSDSASAQRRRVTATEVAAAVPTATPAEPTRLPPTERQIAEFARAIDRQSVEAVRELLSTCYALVNSQFDGEYALFRAINTGKAELVTLFGDYEVSHEIRNSVGDTALHVTIKKKLFQLLPIFTQPHWLPLVNAMNSDHYTPLHLAVRLNLPEIVNYVLMFPNVHCNMKDYEGNVPLHVAINENRDEIIDIMLQSNKVNHSVLNEDGQNPVHLACIKGKAKAIDQILQSKTELINSPNRRGFSPLHLATFHNQAEAVAVILNQKFVHVNSRIMRNREYNSYTALHLAVLKCFPKVVEILIEVGRVEMSLTEDAQLNTPLHMAIENLIKQGCDLTPQALFELQQVATNSFSMNALLDRSPGCQYLAICCYLIAHGARVDEKNKHGMTALDILTSNNRFKHLLSTLKTYEACRSQISNRSPGSRMPSMQMSSSKPSTSATDEKNSAARNDVEGDTCQCCADRRANVRFEPCSHVLFCVVCVNNVGAEMKRCSACQEIVRAKIGPAGEIRPRPRSDHSPVDILCSICMEKPKNVTPRCGHALCQDCARVVQECPMCRSPMIDLRTIFL